MKSLLLILFMLLATKSFSCDSIKDSITDLEAQIVELKTEFNQCMKEEIEEKLLEEAEREEAERENESEESP